MNYQESIDFFTNLTKFGINLGLERINELVRRLGHPLGMSFIHVAGTNGKGSTSAICASILQEAGYKTGLFSSPHLHSYCERFKINQTDISEEKLAALATEIAPYLEQMIADGWESPTEFEVSTALAFLYFHREQADWVVLETGLGGEIDSTNIVNSQIAIITNVAMDHMDYLGDTIAEIATVKSGIIKPSSQVITACTGEALEIMKNKTINCGQHIDVLGENISYQWLEDTAKGQYFSCTVNSQTYERLFIPLLGLHQLSNACLAICAMNKLGVSEEQIRNGLAKVVWPGRLEVISKKPLIVLDGAHNAHCMAALVDSLQRYWPQYKKIGLIGMLADKEREKSMELLLPQLSAAVVTKPPSVRAGNWQRLSELAQAQGLPSWAVENPAQALEMALALVQPDEMLLVTGSLYMIADIRDYLLRKGYQGE